MPVTFTMRPDKTAQLGLSEPDGIHYSSGAPIYLIDSRCFMDIPLLYENLDQMELKLLDIQMVEERFMYIYVYTGSKLEL